ncbi:hypothetical protein BD560DRAFT_383131 [Blakeslea trispora]|nr:hypothetical protein BD560DRAFT_383131 [Blakeslea trispora]
MTSLSSELLTLANAILACQTSARLDENQKPLVLGVRKLKRYIHHDAIEITIWIYNILKAKRVKMHKRMSLT